MKRKICILTAIFIILILAVSAYADFGGFSGGKSGGSRSSRSTNHTQRLHSKNINIWFVVIGSIFVCLFSGLTYLWDNRKPRIWSGKKLKPMKKYSALDPNFDKNKVKDFIADLYFKMQETWQAKDITPIKIYMTDEFFNLMDGRLNYFREDKQTDYTEIISVLEVKLKGWRQENNFDFITAGLESRITSYVLDDTTGEIISGDKDKEIFMEYEIEFLRKSGTISSENFDWQINRMEGVRK